MKWLAGLIVAMVPVAAHAVPPPAGSPDALELQQFTADERAWIARQHDQDHHWCCDAGDFAFVEIRDNNGTLEAKAKHPAPERGIPDGWLDVPEGKKVDVSGQRNIPDVVAAWYYQGRIQCIIMGSGY